jgi:hypothetical protein
MKQGLQAKATQAQATSAAHTSKPAQMRAGGTTTDTAMASSAQLAAQRKMIGAVNASPHMTAQAKQIDGAFGTAIQKKGPKDELQKKALPEAAQLAKKEELKKGGKK